VTITTDSQGAVAVRSTVMIIAGLVLLVFDILFYSREIM
jgi:hypothetical protein